MRHVTVTVRCHHNTDQYNMTLHTALQWLRHYINLSLNSQKTPHILPIRASYRVSIVSILEKTDHVITAPHCIYTSLFIFPQIIYFPSGYLFPPPDYLFSLRLFIPPPQLFIFLQIIYFPSGYLSPPQLFIFLQIIYFPPGYLSSPRSLIFPQISGCSRHDLIPNLRLTEHKTGSYACTHQANNSFFFHLQREPFLLPFLIHIPHVDDLVLELLHWPDLASLPFTFHQNGRLAHKCTSLKIKSK